MKEYTRAELWEKILSRNLTKPKKKRSYAAGSFMWKVVEGAGRDLPPEAARQIFADEFHRFGKFMSKQENYEAARQQFLYILIEDIAEETGSTLVDAAQIVGEAAFPDDPVKAGDLYQAYMKDKERREPP